MKKLTKEEIKEQTRYIERIDPVEHPKEVIDEHVGDFVSVFILRKRDKQIFALLEYDEYLKIWPEDIERIKELTFEQLENGEAYDISEILDEDIVVYDIMEDGRIETCQGFILEIFEE